jgi:hypothetical protein
VGRRRAPGTRGPTRDADSPAAPGRGLTSKESTMFQKLSNSFALARSSWHVLRTDRKLILFPILSGVCCLLLFLSFLVPILLSWDHLVDANGNPRPTMYVLTFAFYFVNYFVVIFFNAALVSCALMKFGGQEPTLGDGLSSAWVRLPQILAWALVSATVGILLRAIESAHEKVGQIVASVLGTAWSIMTYFVVPILVVERVGPFEAIKRSIGVMKKAWGEALVGHFGLGLFALLLFIPVFLLFVAAILAWAYVGQAAGVMLLVVAFLAFVLWMAAFAALQGIYLSALYQFAAHDAIPEGFDEHTMREAFVPKKSE